jgi:hypothetical protein
MRAFQLNGRPGLAFRQELRPLAPELHRRDRVRVHYHPDGEDVAVVDWVEPL